MVKSVDDRYLTLKLYDGVSYDELGTEFRSSHPQIKSAFKEDEIIMDLSGFDIQRTDEELWKSHMKMMSMKQLRYSIDSLERTKEKRREDFEQYMEGVISLSDTSNTFKKRTEAQSFNDLGTIEQRRVVNVAMNMTRNSKNYMNRIYKEMQNRREYINKHKVEWHRKLTLSFAVVILFFIGAPLGAIIKKGGLGLPVVFSVIFFLIFHITSMSGEKMVDSNVMTPFVGMWFSSMVLLPIAVFLTYKAAKDAALFDRDTYIRLFNRISNVFKKKEAQKV
jgi:lipopolysaccharide export system permease protein